MGHANGLVRHSLRARGFGKEQQGKKKAALACALSNRRQKRHKPRDKTGQKKAREADRQHKMVVTDGEGQ